MKSEIVKGLTPVFVVGPPKSGTSFLAALFDSHSNVISLERTRAYSTRVDLDSENEQILSSYYKSTPFEKVNPALNLKDLNGIFGSIRECNEYYSMGGILIAAMLHSILENSNENLSGKTHFVERTAVHAWHVERIIDDFPDAKILFVLRDPRAVYLSNKKRQLRVKTARKSGRSDEVVNTERSGMSRFLSFIPLYRIALSNFEKYEENVKLIIFENLIQNGEAQIREIIDFIGLSWDEILMRPTRHGVFWGGNSQHKRLRGNLNPFDERVLYRWKDELDPFEKFICERVIKEMDYQSIWSPSQTKNPLRLLRALLPFETEFVVSDDRTMEKLKKFVKDYFKTRYKLFKLLS
jgi:hypothetical protein